MEPLKFNHPIIDTHCHLDYLKLGAKEVINQSIEAGVEKIITIAVEPKNFHSVINLSQEWPQVCGSLGVHPHQAKDYSDEVDSTIRQLAKTKKIVAIGEFGLDYHYDHSPRDVQRKVFEKQLQLSVDLNLPIILHTREAEDDTLAILKQFEHSLKKSGVLHCYTSNQELAEYALDRGFKLGFNGVITFKAAENVREILRMTPLQQILLETDAPFLAPLPFRGQENAPKYLPWVVKKMSEVKECDPEELLATIYRSTNKLFALNV